MWAGWITPLCLLPGVWGQTIEVRANPGTPGKWVVLEIHYQAPPGRELVALQWEMAIPTPALDPADLPVARAPLAMADAGKTAVCGTAKKTAETLVLPCLVAGSQKAIPSGTIILLSLKLSEHSQPGAVRIRTQNGFALDRDLKRVPVEPAEAVVTIRSQ